jgi:DNA polymerase-3 subunit epsilon
LEFVGDADLVAHNAEFDMGFINAELARNSFEPIDPSRFIDTLGLAHKKVPSLSRYTLDSLCKYYGIDNSMRDLHGALLDAELLAQVYIELLGGREIDFFKADESGASVSRDSLYSAADGPKKRLEPRDFKASGEELAAHEEFIKSLGSGAFWLDA